jgi:hypothetical protein
MTVVGAVVGLDGRLSRTPGGWSRGLIATVVGIVTVTLFGAVYSLGVHRGSAANPEHAVSGKAYSTKLQISAYNGGATYDVPLHVAWRDTRGVMNFGSRPACLQPSNRIMPIKFAWVDTHREGAWRTVVWVDCAP